VVFTSFMLMAEQQKGLLSA